MSAQDVASEVEEKKVDEISEGVSGLVLESFSFTTAAAIIGYVDSKSLHRDEMDQEYLGD